MIEQDRVISAGSQRDEEAYDRAIRPKTLADYVGQPAVKAQMEIFIDRGAPAPARRSTTC